VLNSVIHTVKHKNRTVKNSKDDDDDDDDDDERYKIETNKREKGFNRRQRNA